MCLRASELSPPIGTSRQTGFMRCALPLVAVFRRCLQHNPKNLFFGACLYHLIVSIFYGSFIWCYQDLCSKEETKGKEDFNR